MQSYSFKNFDAFADTVRDADMDMMLCNPKHRNWNIDFVDLGGIHVQVGRMGSGNLVQGQADADKYVLYAPLNADSEHSLNGSVVTKDAVAIIEPGREFYLDIPFAHDWFSVGIPIRMLTGRGDAAKLEFDSERSDSRVTRENRGIANRLRESALQIMTAATAGPQFESGPAAISASEALLQSTLPVLGRSLAVESRDKGRPRVPRMEIIDRAMALMEARRGEPVLVGELAAAAKVSERTLRTAFNEYFGTGPVHYLQLRQLHHVHRGLATADPDAVSVTEVLTQNGVWQWGRFAAHYRKLFGELPSETLRTKRRQPLV
jgi:AraC family ethanolamine operon transcriptional activator